MPIAKLQDEVNNLKLESKLDPKYFDTRNYTQSNYAPTPEESDTRSLIIRHFVLGDNNMQQPRVELNDLSVLTRMQIDQMSFNAYQPNNGQPATADILGAWRSNALRPIVRNKCMSIAAHATARLIFPKIFARNEEFDEEKDGAQVMEDLLEYAGDNSNYAYHSLQMTIAAMTDPVAISYTDYAKVYRTVKRPNDSGKGWTKHIECDEDQSGFHNLPVPADQIYIENFFEPDIQKQGFLIWRRVISYSEAEMKYKALYPNFQYVNPGMQIIYNDANQSFYQIYDNNMRAYDVEELLYWNKALDLYSIVVNGVLLTEADQPNPRQDKLYPFAKFGYELINNRCFYYKSLAFKLQQDASIVNTLYPMIIDGTYLTIMPPMMNTGDEEIGSDVIVPGQTITLKSIDAKLQPILNTNTGNNLAAGLKTLETVEASVDDASASQINQGQQTPGQTTAYEISRLEQNASTELGLFVKMIGDYVMQFGKLRLGDILQYLTIADIDKIVGEKDLVYKSFLIPKSGGKESSRKIKFEPNLPENPTDAEELKMSFELLKAEKETDDKTTILKINPKLFRELKFNVAMSPDILNPRSEDLERAYGLEAFDQSIQGAQVGIPIDLEQVYKDFILGMNPISKKDPDKYIRKEQPGQTPGMPPQPGQQPQPGQPNPQLGMGGGQPPQAPGGQAKPSPFMSQMNKLPQTM